MIGTRGRRRERSREGRNDGEVKLELTPMIDVTFLILVFFLCTLSFKTLEGKLAAYLPLAEGLRTTPQRVEVESARLVLSVHPEDRDRPAEARRILVARAGAAHPFGVWRLGTTRGADEVAELRATPEGSEAAVKAWFATVRETSPEAKAEIAAGPRVPHAVAVHALNLARQAGFVSVAWAGTPRDLLPRLRDGSLR